MSPRAAHAAQQPADPGQAAVRQQGREPHRQAGRVRQDDLRVGRRPADADQRDPRPVQGRGRQDAGRAARRRARPTSPSSSSDRSARWPSRRTWRSRPTSDADAAARDPHRSAAAAAGPQEPARERASSSPSTRLVTLRVQPAEPGTRFANEALRSAERVIAFAVVDTGIGIAEDKQKLSSRRSSRPTAPPAASTAAPAWACRSAARSPACSAARSTSTASRARAARSRSTCPSDHVAPDGRPTTASGACRRRDDRGARAGQLRERRQRAAVARRARRAIVTRPIDDDREHIRRGRPRAAGHRGRREVRADHAADGAREGLQGGGRDPRRHRPGAGQRATSPTRSPSTSSCPVIDGWSVLDRLKRNPRTRHIPVHVISRRRGEPARRRAGRVRLPREAGQQGGAGGRLRAHHRASSIARCARCCWSRTTTPSAQTIVELVGEGDDVAGHGGAHRARRPLSALEKDEFDCMVVDLILPGRRRHPADREGARRRPVRGRCRSSSTPARI